MGPPDSELIVHHALLLLQEELFFIADRTQMCYNRSDWRDAQ